MEEQHNPNNTADAAQATNETVLTEIQHLLDTTAHTFTVDDVDLIRKMLPEMVEDDNQPLPKNVPTDAEENVSDPHSSSQHGII